MSERGLAWALAAALLAGIAVAWTPRYWAEAVATASLSIIAILWAVTARRIALSRWTALAALIGLWALLQLALHRSVTPWLTTLSSLTWLLCAVSFLVGSQVLRNDRGRRAFLDVLLWAATALAIIAILQMYVTPGRVFGIFPAAKSVVGSFFYKNQFAAMIELTAPIALWKVYEGEVLRGGLSYAALAAAVVTSASRAGVILVAAEFAAALILMVYGRRMRLKSAAAIAALLVLLAGGALAVAGTERIWSRFEEPHPYGLRAMLLNSTLRMIPAHPWLGSGLGTWHVVYPAFATFDSGVYINEAHNDWVQWAAEGGLPFAVLMAILVVGVARPSATSVWGLGVLSVMIHSAVDYPLGEPVLKFLWFAMAGSLSALERGREHVQSPLVSEASTSRE